jgi:hypothetical protein
MAEEDMTALSRRAHFDGLSGRSDELSLQGRRRNGRLAYRSPSTAAERPAANGKVCTAKSSVLVAEIVVVGVIAL